MTIASINNTFVVNDASASDYVVTISSINGAVGTDNQGSIGNDRVVTITSINGTVVGKVINASYYLVTIR
jgi:hypothetical protein